MNKIAPILLFLLILAAPLAGAVELDPALRALLRSDRVALEGLQHVAGNWRPPYPRALLTPGAPARLEVFLSFEPGVSPAWRPEESAVDLGHGRWAARLSPVRIHDLVEAGTLASARLSRPVYPALDRSAPFLGMEDLRREDPLTREFTGTTGRGVVVGCVDGGFDFGHSDFRWPDGSTRFYRYWDQGSISGSSPNDFPFGGEWHPQHIDDKVSPPAHRDFDGHGSHVLGIAAGNGRASAPLGGAARFVGMAPEATLVGVRTVFTEFGVVTGVQYIFNRAEELGMPAVVNLSLGNHFGPHVGETPFERALEGLTGPGRLIVAAAGNSADDDHHAEIRLSPGETTELRFQVPPVGTSVNADSFADFEGWYHPDDRFRVTLLDPRGDLVRELVFGDEETMDTVPRGDVYTWHTTDQGHRMIEVELVGNPRGQLPISGIWTLRVEALSTPAGGEMDFWVTGWWLPGAGGPTFMDHLDVEETILVPGTARGLLTVGAVTTRECWPSGAGGEVCYTNPGVNGEPAAFSSMGPTSDGRIKPEIMAPGFGVVSVRSSTISSTVYSAAELARLSTPDGRYLVSQGTSMSAPHVAGVTALLLERFPTLTPDLLRARLVGRGIASVDPRSGEVMTVLDPLPSAGPVARALVTQLLPEKDAIRVRWGVDKTEFPVTFRVYRGFHDRGPYHRVDGIVSLGRSSYEVLDRLPEPGRSHFYRVTAVDEFGLEEDLDTLSIDVPGVPMFTLRPPDPNPARESVNLRYFLAPAPGGSRYSLDVIDVRGRIVRNLVAADVIDAQGEERITVWDLRDRRGIRVGAGVYWIRLRYDATNTRLPGTPASITPVSPEEGTRVQRVVVLQ